MGSGITQVSAQSGFQPLVVEANDELLQRGLSRLRQTLEGLVEKGKLDAKAKDGVLARISGTVRLEDLAADRLTQASAARAAPAELCVAPGPPRD